MDATTLARSLLEPIPAHRTAGIQVRRASDGAAEVELVTPPAMTNVIGSLHSSGLVALVDAAGLAAIIAACDTQDDFSGVVPLGSAASLEFRAPAHGRLVASCHLDQEARVALRPVLSGRADRARVTTVAEVVDDTGALVCRGTFQWSIRRDPTRRGSVHPAPDRAPGGGGGQRPYWARRNGG
jgi:acyl-coenzyme A thioesterase PaaI-like protein